MNLNDQIDWIANSFQFILPEFIITLAAFLIVILGLILHKNKFRVFQIISVTLYLFVFVLVIISWPTAPLKLFGGMMRLDDFSSYFKLLFLTGGIITFLISQRKEEHASEYFLLLHAVVIGSCFLAMSLNFVMILLSLELISLSSYMLAGFDFNRKSAEGALKYFLFGTVATAVMIYGFTILYGLAGTLDISSRLFINNLLAAPSHLLLAGCLLTLAGFLFKIAATPFHLWAPDVYESAPTPIVAFFSVVPKLAGFAVLIRFVLAIGLFGQSYYHWPSIIGCISVLSILVGNFSALAQTNAKRMMAYSSIAQSGFLLIGLVGSGEESVHAFLFYATIFLIMNFLVFAILQQFEQNASDLTMQSFTGMGRVYPAVSIALLVAMISLTGLPPTGGFTGKLFIFSSLWQSYQSTGRTIMLWLFIIGLANTVVSLFYYLKIPYYLFIRESASGISLKRNLPAMLLTCILAALLIYLFFQPGLLMGWINKITFVL